MRSRNTGFLIVFAAVALFGGLIQQCAPHTPSLLLQSGLPYGLMALAMIFAWYRRDANDRGYARTLGLNVMVAAFTMIALPYYLFRSRGFWRGMKATLGFLGVLILYEILDGTGHLLAYFLQTRS